MNAASPREGTEGNEAVVTAQTLEGLSGGPLSVRWAQSSKTAQGLRQAEPPPRAHDAAPGLRDIRAGRAVFTHLAVMAYGTVCKFANGLRERRRFWRALYRATGT